MNYKDLLKHVPAPGEAINLAWALDAFPALRLLATTPQDPHYHAEGDVWTHTVMVVNELVNGGDYAASTAEQRFIVFFAALLQDSCDLM